MKNEDRAIFPGEAAIEAICQRALALTGIRAAHTWTEVVGNHQVVVSERSDRTYNEKRRHVTPIHQEEWVCASGLQPDDLIQRGGAKGGWVELHRFLTQRARTPESEHAHFWRALTSIALLGHRDMHRRNVGIRYSQPGGGFHAELAPLYDVASMDGQRTPHFRSLGMPIGGQEALDELSESNWTTIARQCDTEPERVLTALRETARRLPDAIATTASRAANIDEWRPDDEENTLKRIEALKSGTATRAKRILGGSENQAQHQRYPGEAQER